MTREKAIEILYQYSVQDMTYPKEDIEAFELAIKALEEQQNPNSIRINFVGEEEAKEFDEYLKNQQESVLDKIRSEIEEYKSRQSSLVTGVDDLESTGIAYVKGKQVALEYVLAIIDKYKAESEE